MPTRSLGWVAVNPEAPPHLGSVGVQSSHGSQGRVAQEWERLGSRLSSVPNCGVTWFLEGIGEKEVRRKEMGLRKPQKSKPHSERLSEYLRW